MRTFLQVQRNRSEHGAVAVEFALVLVPLLLIVFGIVDFGRALNAQITLTQAAREGARVSALGTGNVTDTVRAAAVGVNITTVNVTACPSSAAADARTTVTARTTFTMVTPLAAVMALIPGGGGFGGTIPMAGTAVMRCGG
jgi:Flp pilus assembly protein TadG